MEKHYYEQTVTPKAGVGGGTRYVLCWIVIFLFLIPAMFFGANIFGSDPEVLSINWLFVLLMTLCLAVSACIFLRKDYLRMEYDYVLSDDVFAVYGILNRRRRKLLAEIPLDQISACGVYRAGTVRKVQSREHKWFLNSDQRIYYMCYSIKNEKHLALLELDDCIAARLRSNRNLRPGTWKNTEGKTMNYAGLS